jgi:hypothetical protein
LPAGAQATPMTYEIGGTQYVVMSAGGHGKLGTSLGDYVTAFSLPEGGSNPAVDVAICHDAVAWSGHRFKVNPFFNQTATLVLLPRSRVCCH